MMYDHVSLFISGLSIEFAGRIMTYNWLNGGPCFACPAVRQHLGWTARLELALGSLRTTSTVTLRETNISRNIIFRNPFLYVGTIHYGLCKEIR